VRVPRGLATVVHPACVSMPPSSSPQPRLGAALPPRLLRTAGFFSSFFSSCVSARGLGGLCVATPPSSAQHTEGGDGAGGAGGRSGFRMGGAFPRAGGGWVAGWVQHALAVHASACHNVHVHRMAHAYRGWHCAVSPPATPCTPPARQHRNRPSPQHVFWARSVFWGPTHDAVAPAGGHPSCRPRRQRRRRARRDPSVVGSSLASRKVLTHLQSPAQACCAGWVFSRADGFTGAWNSQPPAPHHPHLG
jgi:hypothetical protein